MNRTAFLLLILALLLTIFSIKTYITSQKELNKQYSYTKKIIKTAKEIEYLKTAFKPYIPGFCKVEKNEKIVLECKNLTKYRLRSINQVLINSKIISFDIEKNKTINARLEIGK